MRPNYKKRRAPHGPSKNELRAARSEKEELHRTRQGTLQQRFPHAKRADLDLRLETPNGTVLDQILRVIGPDEPLVLDVACPGGCGGGRFLLTDAVEKLLQNRSEAHEGMAICQASSYGGPGTTCGTKLYYRITIVYEEVDQPDEKLG